MKKRTITFIVVVFGILTYLFIKDIQNTNQAAVERQIAILEKVKQMQEINDIAEMVTLEGSQNPLPKFYEYLRLGMTEDEIIVLARNKLGAEPKSIEQKPWRLLCWAWTYYDNDGKPKRAAYLSAIFINQKLLGFQMDFFDFPK